MPGPGSSQVNEPSRKKSDPRQLPQTLSGHTTEFYDISEGSTPMSHSNADRWYRNLSQLHVLHGQHDVSGPSSPTARDYSSKVNLINIITWFSYISIARRTFLFFTIVCHSRKLLLCQKQGTVLSPRDAFWRDSRISYQDMDEFANFMQPREASSSYQGFQQADQEESSWYI